MEILQNHIIKADIDTIYTDNGVWGYFKITPHSSGVQNSYKEEQHIFEMTDLLNQLAIFEDIQLLLLPTIFDTDDKIDILQRDYKGFLKDNGVSLEYLKRARKIFKEENENSKEDNFYIGVKLKQSSESEETYGIDTIRKFANQVQSIAGFKPYILPKERDKYRESINLAYIYLTAVFPDIKICDENEMKFLSNYPFFRKNVRRQNKSSNVILNFSELGTIKFIKNDGFSYVTYLAIAEMPISMQYMRFMYSIQGFNFPISLSVRLHYENNGLDLVKINFQKKILDEQSQQKTDVNDRLDPHLIHGVDILERLEQRCEKESKPLINASFIYSIEGKTPKECRQRANDFVTYMKKSYNIQLFRPVDQVFLFDETLIGSRIQKQEYTQKINAEGIAEGIFGHTRKVGNNSGFILGKDISLKGETPENSNNLVMFNQFLGHLGLDTAKTASPHILITGATGMGKTQIAKYINMEARFYGATCIVIDPKNEWEIRFKRALEKYGHHEYFNTLISSINYITLSADKENTGKLDPTTFLKNEHDKKSCSVSILETMGAVKQDERNLKTAISKSIDKCILEKTGLLGAVKDLKEQSNQSIKELGNLLHEKSKEGLSKLLFSDGNQSSYLINEKSGNMTIIGVQNLNFPDEKKPREKYNSNDLTAIAVMETLIIYVLQLSREIDGIKSLTFEEAWFLKRLSAGTEMVNEVLRTGRALQTSMILSTQSGEDYNNQEMIEQIGTNFAFKAEDQREQDLIIDYLKLEKSSYTSEMLSTLKKGECIYKDIYGRTAKIYIDVPYGEWKEAFSTTEQADERIKAEELGYVDVG